MSRKLTAGVIVRHPGRGSLVFLPSGSELPEWATRLVGDHALTPDEATQAIAEETDPEGPASTTDAGPPPRSGTGSGRAAWAAYATSAGVEIADKASRDDIIATCAQAGIAT